jgi:flagellar hook protein FlgE
MIQGDGFFVVQQGSEAHYTRAGAFTLDESGGLVTPTGSRVMGYGLDGSGNAITGSPLKPISLSTETAYPAVPAGVQLTSYNIGPDGRVRGIFDDGVRRDLCQLAIANFQNPGGLEKVGETAYRASASSGDADISVSGVGRRGIMMAGAVEMSNVDLAAEFTNLILAQRGFQASSRIITTSDQVLEDLVNIKR